VPPAARALQAAAPGFEDAYRHLHRNSQCYTFHSPVAASRIDAFQVSPAAASRVVRCWAGACGVSDHRTVFLDLTTAQPLRVGPGLRRVHVQRFWGDPVLREEFQEWLEEAAEGAPEGAAQLLLWWPGFKFEISVKARQLCAVANRKARLSGAPSRAAAAAALTAAFAAVDTAAGGGSAALGVALEGVLAARAAWKEQVQQQRQAAKCGRPQSWRSGGELPSARMTGVVRPQCSAEAQPAVLLRSEAGAMLEPGMGQANTVIGSWAKVSAARAADVAAQAAVLQAVATHGKVLGADDAAALGDAHFTEVEVRRALKGSKPGTAPGEDGIPVGVYQGHKALFVPLLTRLFVAMGEEGHVHAGGLDGVVVSLFKAGDRAEISNYRPITLLNTDYRVLAKVLASRLQRVLGTIISPEQTAFLQGRRIGENVFFLRALAEGLPLQSGAVVACLDFRKAYDTVDRAFLLQLMRAMGVPDAFLALVEMLLAGTKARACVNGYVSRPALYEAGVRQGCPLAPLLYLFVGQALLCHLKATLPGVRLGGAARVAVQYADDAQVVLPCWEQVPAFVAAMEVFGRASGQFMNLSKTLLLPVGALARCRLWGWVDAGCAEQPPPALQAVLSPAAVVPSVGSRVSGDVPSGCSVCGLRVVGEAKVLGVTLSAAGVASADWAGLESRVLGAYGRLADMGLSVFGRAMAVGAYGVSQFFYQGEHSGLPPLGVLTRLSRATAKLVDRGLAPTAEGRNFCGVQHELLAGGPREGGFGALPWEAHMHARHAAWLAKWAVAAFCSGSAPQPPFVAAVMALWRGEPPLAGFVAGGLLAGVPVAGSSVADFLTAFVVPGGSQGPGGRPLPVGPGGLAVREPLLGWVRAFWRLPAPTDVPGLGHAAGRMPLGDWCADVPLWHNPLVVPRYVDGELRRSELHTRFAALYRSGCCTSLGHLARGLVAVLDPGCLVGGPAARVRSLFPLSGGPAALGCVGWLQVHALLLKVASCLEPSWWQAAQGVASDVDWVPGSAEERAEAEANMLRRLGWACMPGVLPRRPVWFVGLTVKQATRLQQGPLALLRCDRWEAYRAAACRLRAPPRAMPAAAPVLLRRLFAGMWRVRWDNPRKEVLWRLVYDALPTVERLHLPGVHCCQCGVASPGREHHFWDCPVAQAVRDQLQRALPAGLAAVYREQLWLALAPGGVRLQVWRVVVLAALGAMERGRKMLYSWRLAVSPVAPNPAALPLDMQLQVAQRAAVVGFWDNLQDFVSGGPGAVACLGDRVGPLHPFIRCVRGVFSVNLLPGAL
jgi:hypothetical protein